MGQKGTNYYSFVQSVGYANCKHATVSYRWLPPSINVPHCSGRTKLCEDVLNDKVVSIPVGSEDYGFKSTRKNVYEEALFKCEDERFELDMTIATNNAAIRALEPMAKKIQHLSLEQVCFPDFVQPSVLKVVRIC